MHSAQEPFPERLARFYSTEASRLHNGDPAVWSDDPEVIKTISNRLGWLDSPRWVNDQVATITQWADSLIERGIKDVVLLGMGGSSLAPEVCRDVFGVKPSHPALHVLDNTHPDAIAAIENNTDPNATLFIVASKSGSTIETRCFADYFFAQMTKHHGDRAGDFFVAITDSGSNLEKQAGERGYSQTFINPSDIGGRYSALSYFGLVPAAAIGIDIAELATSAIQLKRVSDISTKTSSCPGIGVGVALGMHSAEGRNKLTLLSSPVLEPLGVWIEQLVAESTGKEGKGILPITGEAIFDSYPDDRVFTVVRTEDDTELKTLAARLRGEGHPVYEWTVDGAKDLGAEFMRWELITVIAGCVMDINPFDEPNVTESKNKTGEFLERVRGGDDVAAELSLPFDGGVANDVAQQLKNWIKDGDYVAILAYGAMDDAAMAALESLRTTIGASHGVACTTGIGPRFLHSTGQLHKGGDASGIFLEITTDFQNDIDIPGESFSFGQLNACQALGDLEVLEDRDRRVLRVHFAHDVQGNARILSDAIAS